MPAPKIVQHLLESTRPKYTTPLRVQGAFLFLSDIEVPYHNAEFLNQCIGVAKAAGIRQVVLGGDLLHLEAFSPFLGADEDADSELNEIEEHLPGLLEPFEQVFYFVGNHDQRLQRRLMLRISNEKALRMAIPDKLMAKIQFSEYFWCEAGTDWLLEHQVNNSTVPTRVAQSLSSKFGKNVITAHTHKCGMVRINGYWAIDAGCCVDIERLAYTSLRHSTHTTMQNGAVLMEWYGGHYIPTLLTPDRMEYLLWQKQKRR